MNLGLGLKLGGGGGSRYLLPGAFAARWVVTGADPEEVVVRTANVLIEGAGAISVIGTTTYSTDGITYTADAGTITTGKLWVKDTASADYETLVEGGVTIDTVDCDFSITTMERPLGGIALNPDGSDMLNPDASTAHNPA